MAVRDRSIIDQASAATKLDPNSSRATRTKIAGAAIATGNGALILYLATADEFDADAASTTLAVVA
ncbi:MAG: hypothetical protein ACRYGI_09640 [Janthinobacterium lividum]